MRIYEPSILSEHYIQFIIATLSRQSTKANVPAILNKYSHFFKIAGTILVISNIPWPLFWKLNSWQFNHLPRRIQEWHKPYYRHQIYRCSFLYQSEKNPQRTSPFHRIIHVKDKYILLTYNIPNITSSIIIAHCFKKIAGILRQWLHK